MVPPNWTSVIAIVFGTILLGLVARLVIYRALRNAIRGSTTVATVSRAASGPVTLILQLVAVLLVARYIAVPEPIGPLLALVRHVAALAFIGSVAWLAVALLLAAEEIVSARFPLDVTDNLAARRVQTRVAVFRRLGVAIVVFIAISAMLITFPSVQHLGTSLLASAGVVGIVAGVAAQRTIGNLIAGLQIAMSQPIRLDDVVVIDGEWGWVDEIGSTHVSVRLWDLRHLVVPLSYIIERPFQNWTRQSADLLATVLIYADYSVPVDELREELHRVLEETDLWDGGVWGLQVTNTTPRAVELRALMSARDGPTAWDLRCHVRERLVEFLQGSYPHSLPRNRIEVTDVVASGDAGPESRSPTPEYATGTGVSARRGPR